MKQNRDITSLEDNFELRFRTAFEEYNDKYEPNIFIVEALRTQEQQLVYYKSGKSGVKVSNHMNGKAVDIGFRWPQLYPTDDATRLRVCEIMRKYGIVNWYYDLMWHKAKDKKKRLVDKPHFQAVEVQTPTINNSWYSTASDRKNILRKEIAKNSSKWHILINLFSREKLKKRNDLLRQMIQ